MGSVERRERERVELRKKILDAAREIMVKEGYAAVSLRKVAEKIEYSPTAIYLHFKDKRALMWELCVGDFFALAEELTQIAAETDPIERMRKAGLAYAHYGLKHPQHYQFMFMTPIPEDAEVKEARDEMKQGPWRGNPQFDAYAFARANAQEAIEAGRLRPELKDADLVAQTLWAGVHGVVALHVARANDDWVDWRPAKKRVELMVDALVRGLEKHPARGK
jgi:AcrR family transcriptional regulator